MIIESFGVSQIWDPKLTAWEIMYKVTVEKQLPRFDHLPSNIVPCCEGSIYIEENRLSSKKLLERLISAFAHTI